VRGTADALHGAIEMPQTINTNLASLNAQRALNATQGSLNTSMQRLSSGMRVNSAKDDAAGIAIADRMQTQVRGMNVAMRNANDAISLLQTAEGMVGQVNGILQRMRELAVQAANASNNTGDRSNLQSEFQQLSDEVNRMLRDTTFNGLRILGVDGGNTQIFQIGPNSGDTITFQVANLVSSPTIVNITGADPAVTASAIDTPNGATTVLANIDAALDVLNTERATYGAVQNRMDAIIEVMQVNAENTAAARGRIMDADFARETANLARAQILQQAGSAMLAQANAMPQQVLQLLKG
jgi:flagellin